MSDEKSTFMRALSLFRSRYVYADIGSGGSKWCTAAICSIAPVTPESLRNVSEHTVSIAVLPVHADCVVDRP